MLVFRCVSFTIQTAAKIAVEHIYGRRKEPAQDRVNRPGLMLATVFCLLAYSISVRSSHAQGLTIVSTLPADSSTGVPLETEVEILFDLPLDTTAGARSPSEPANGLPVGTFIGPRDSVVVGPHHLNEDGVRLTIEVAHQPETDYVWIVTGAAGADTTSLDVPRVLRYTTASEWGPHAVRGEVWAFALVKRGATDIRDMVVALLDAPLSQNSDWTYTGFERIVAAVGVPEGFEFEIDRVRDGTYWPVAFIDVDGDGRIGEGDRAAPYGETESDSIVVQGEDVEDVFLSITLGGSTESPEQPSAARLGTIHPNPTRGMARVDWELAGPAVVSVRLFNLLGQEILTVVADEWLPSGSHQAQVDASALAAGAYFCRLSIDGVAHSRILFVTK